MNLVEFLEQFNINNLNTHYNSGKVSVNLAVLSGN